MDMTEEKIENAFRPVVEKFVYEHCVPYYSLMSARTIVECLLLRLRKVIGPGDPPTTRAKIILEGITVMAFGAAIALFEELFEDRLKCGVNGYQMALSFQTCVEKELEEIRKNAGYKEENEAE